MGTYYSQPARGFLFPSSQPAPASKSGELGPELLVDARPSGQTALVLRQNARPFSITQRGGPPPKNLPCNQTSRKRAGQVRARPTRFSDFVAGVIDFPSCKQMLRAVGSGERSRCPGLRAECRRTQSRSLNSNTLPQPAGRVWE